MVTLPVNHGSFEADVLAGLFGLNPFVPQDLFAFGEEFGVKRRPGRQIGVFVRCRFFLHSYLS